MGHPFMAPGKIKIDSPDQYVEALEAAHVLPEIGKRKQLVLDAVTAVAKGLDGRIQPDDDLTDIVTNLVDIRFRWPVLLIQSILSCPKRC